ncbi:hypothetical protein PF005_g10781 [Phytophthora fragariae]|uniref:Crinkler effector protein N-terminal domain-containing protein n=1 Tax=Phytophthora fragariae TaxID=53985 RepID=A0A6A3EXA3_9STRA|nr:hypothetical protein PF003_g11416 [Phytophthora fragariae]KAE8938164.1 hypothetical protein PF009_g11938 [Phytophthora fragariae]KAE9011183.1 hypothetical protein PF011_g9478 [Phytophthora fragariae]KAE9119075.1 hypothetical protein PF007_g8678 [Phytophthora fragariae]KAE9145025.1 hypothetical protein PF006_g10083 [Phytophthora fragariae]
MDVKMTLPPTNEIKLVCGVYHLAKMYSVVTRLEETVESVRAKLGEKLSVLPHNLRLYLAKNDDGWLKADKNLDILLSRGPVKNESGDTEFEEIWPSQLLSSHFDQQIPDGMVHMLVKLPKKNLKRRKTDVEAPSALKTRKVPMTFEAFMAPLNLDELKVKASKSGDLPKDGDFLKLLEWDDDDCGKVKDIQTIGDIVSFTGSKFYVRKEILRVLENFKKFLHVKLGITTEEFRKEQFIFMGSPGMG